MTFEKISIGALFNTQIARWVKTSSTEAICVWSAIYPLGKIIEFEPETEIVVLWSSDLKG